MIEQAVLEYAANSIWQVPMLAAMAWLLVWLGRPGPRAQHWLWLATLALAILLPLRGFGRFGVSAVRAPIAMIHATRSGPAADAPQVIHETREFNWRASEPAVRPGASRQNWSLLRGTSWLPLHSLRLSRRVAYWLLELYLSALIFRLIQLARAWRAARKLVARATDAALSQAAQAMLARFCERFNVRRPRVLISEHVASPITVGAVRPALLLPKTFHENTETEMAAVLCHELAHVRRRDYFVNLACQAAALPIAYHPATYAVQRRVRQTREMVCDTMAGNAMLSASGYARCLVALAQRILNGRDIAERVQAIGMFDNNSLEERVMGLLEKKTRLNVGARLARTAAGMALMTSVAAAAMIFHVTPTVVNAAEATVPAVQTAGGTHGSADRNVSQQTSPTPAPVPSTATALPSTEPTPAPATTPVGSGHAVPKPEKPIPRIVNRERRDLTPEQRSRLEKELAAANAAVREETQLLQSPEFKKQMADMQQQIQQATKKLRSEQVQRQMRMLQSPELKKQMADMQQQIQQATKKLRSEQVQRQMRMLQSPELKKQMADMQQQIQQATNKLRSDQVQRQMQMLQSPEFKKQMQDMQQRIQDATKKLQSDQVQRQVRIIQSPEFKKQMQDMQQRIQDATKKLQSDQVQRQVRIIQSPEFKKQMQDMQQRIQDATKKLQSDQVQRQVRIIQSPEFKKQMEDMQRQMEDMQQRIQGAAKPIQSKPKP